MCESVEAFRAEKQRNALKCILLASWFFGYLLLIGACVDFTNIPGWLVYLFDALPDCIFHEFEQLQYGSKEDESKGVSVPVCV